MNDLVVLTNNQPAVSTFDLFVAMGYGEHRALKKIISDNISDFEEFGVVRFQMQKPTAKGGRPTQGYLLNEDQFILLVLLARNSKEVIALKIRVAKEFSRLKKVVANIVSQQKDPNWQNVRSDGKIVYKQKTDVIKDFVDYATKQGSTSAHRYYTNLAKMENKALFLIEQKYKNLREILTIKQLMQSCTADDVIEKALIDGMNKEMDYKEIYKLARDRIHSFAEIIGRSQVHFLTDN